MNPDVPPIPVWLWLPCLLMLLIAFFGTLFSQFPILYGLLFSGLKGFVFGVLFASAFMLAGFLMQVGANIGRKY